MNLNCLAIDDEPLALKLIKKYVEKIPYLQLKHSFESAYEANFILKTEPIDLIFLDINMPDLSGIQFVRHLAHSPLVIFTTAYEKYAVEGYELNAIDYLLKPYSFERFLKASDKALNFHLLSGKTPNLVWNEGAAAGQTDPLPSCLFINADHKIVRIDFEDILYIQSFKDYVKIHCQSQKYPYLSLQTMHAVESLLPKNHFMRVHRSYIVSLEKIKAIERRHLEIAGNNIPISETYLPNFQNWLSKKRTLDG
ncbi:MAG: LytTR family DNA-binding domain-containing protein [Microscillaceae bacterium]